MLGQLVDGTLNESEMRVVLFTKLVFHSSAYFPQQANGTVAPPEDTDSEWDEDINVAAGGGARGAVTRFSAAGQGAAATVTAEGSTELAALKATIERERAEVFERLQASRDAARA